MKTKTPAGTVNILLVDDDPRNLEVLRSLLEAPDLRLVSTTNPDDALLSLVNDEFACIILDIQMPGMSGLELARIIKTRKRNQHIPIIFLTAYFLEERDVLQGYGAGAVDYLTKPLNPQILKSKVGVFVELFRSNHALATANEALESEIGQRKSAEEALRQVNNELETRVQERTSELAQYVAELKRSEEATRRLAAIVESSDDAIVSKDLNGIIATWNESAQRIFGYSAEEVIGKSITILIPPDRLEEEAHILACIRRGEPVHHYETVRRCKDGRLVEVSLSVSPIKNGDGTVAGASKIARDITERKRAEMELKKAHQEVLAASRAKDDFLATLSHELRTPLNPVLLIASDAANNRELPPRIRTDFDTIRKNVEMEARLIDDLLDLTRIARGRIILERYYLNVHQVLQDAIAQEREGMEKKGVQLELKLNAPQQTVHADAVRLQQIFWNLLSNAVKFTPAGGKITVETTVNMNKLLVKIADTGLGMTYEEIGQIFSAFTQGRHVSENGHRFGGLGLGLAISQKLAELHYGRITAISEGRNKGSVFIVELPLALSAKAGEGANPRQVENPAASSAKKYGIRVLLVEDHEPTRTSLARLLMHRYYDVVTASSVAEARQLASAAEFHLLISDIGLPDGNGYDLMLELRKIQPLKGIALTGYGMEQDVARSQDAGFSAHLTKPVGIQSLETALNAAL